MPRYIVIVSPSYGGAEKRFFDIYTGLRRAKRDIFYVAPSTLVDQLRADHPERRDVFDGLVAIDLPKWDALRFVWRYGKLLRGLPRRSTFHYPMHCLWPLHVGRNDSLSLSFVDCTMVPKLTARHSYGRLCYIAFFFVHKIDILSPSIFAAVRKSRMGRKAALTPGGTFLLPPRVLETKKKPIITFFSRLIEEKGILDFLDVVPALWSSLKGRVPKDFRLVIAGYGPLSSHVAEASAALRTRGIPIDFVGYKSAEEVVVDSAIVLSLQKTTNYPSRVVAESLVSGCAVIVRKSGDSTEFGYDLPGREYCEDALDAAELGHAIAAMIGKVCGREDFCMEVHARALRRFYSEDYLEYFDAMLSGGKAGHTSPAQS
jgi:glycosyltransferase involved in cell wall biosynthesis